MYICKKKKLCKPINEKKKSPSLIINLRKWNKDVNSLCEHCLVVEDTSSIFYINVRSPSW